MFEKLYINQYAYYQPPKETPKESPKLDYVDPLFKRRLSQLSRMTIEVVKQVKDAAPDAKIVFASLRGEIGRQLKINRSLVDEFDILPAQFSLSVFNTPPAVATIALGLKNGYTAVYPSEGRLYDAFVSAVAPVLAGIEKHVIFVYGDELIPDEYAPIETSKEKIFFPLHLLW
ncbi:MAG: beta-ketoacyl synthase chain length factor [Treponema sp.]|nr:beta-ketoacyl synthase chain length factor [Treponema sp.]